MSRLIDADKLEKEMQVIHNANIANQKEVV